MNGGEADLFQLLVAIEGGEEVVNLGEVVKKSKKKKLILKGLAKTSQGGKKRRIATINGCSDADWWLG